MATKRRSVLSHRSVPCRGLWFGIGLLLAAVLATPASAQQYAVDPVDEKAGRQHGGKVPRWAGNPAVYNAEKVSFDEYYDKYYFPAMTRHLPDDLAALGDMRHNLFRRMLWNTNNEQLQRDLTLKAARSMSKVVQAQNPPYHPAVRYNAVLVLGMLDGRYAVETGPNRRSPEPLQGATRLLTTVIESADESQYPPAVVLGALIGLERHAQYRETLPQELVDAMSAAALNIVNRDQPIQDMDRDAYAWLRLRAASVLANLGSVGPNNEVHEALLKFAAESRSIDDRCAAAALLEKLKYEEVKLAAPATLKPLLTLARDVAAAEDKRAEEFQEAHVGGGGFAPGPGVGRFGGGGLYGEQMTFPRRQLLARLVDLRTGLRAVKPALPEESQKTIDEVVEAIRPAIAAAQNKDTVDLALARIVRTMAGEVNRVAVLPEEPAEAEEAEEESAS